MYFNIPVRYLALQFITLTLLGHSIVFAGEFGTADKLREPNRTELPIPQPRYSGNIGRYIADSDKPVFPPPIKAPIGASNVLVIMLDDVGFGQTSTFGGGIPTPALDELAQQGLSFNNFHTTSMCSPTRAALLTGRNHHSVGSGRITKMALGYDSYNSVIRRETASIAEILKQNGYATAMFGKNHNTPEWETSQVGPFDRWPTGLGFEYFYGFQGGETDQFGPTLYENTSPVADGKRSADYHLTSDLADRAIKWIHELKSIAPEKPYLVYVAPGATHAPHQAPEEWIKKFDGKFDSGWDEYRKQTLERQKRMGIVPADTKLTDRPPGLPAWDSLSADQRRLYAREMEVFAAFTAHTDYEMGRLISAVRSMPDGNNTAIIYIVGDNGASAEGGPNGNLNLLSTVNSQPEDIADTLAHIDELGSEKHFNHFSYSWAHAMNTPFKWYKMVASHFGATRNGLVVSWPNKISQQGLRPQLHHVIDIAPTILEMARLPEPVRVNGVKQMPIQGVSMAYTFDKAKQPSKRKTQYFEFSGNRAIYHDGWYAASKSFALSDYYTGKNLTRDPSQATWELYNTNKDFSQANDIAAQHPSKLSELEKLFWREAEKFQVLPIVSIVGRQKDIDGTDRPSHTSGKTQFSYRSGTQIPESNAPTFKNTSYRVEAEVDLLTVDDGGVLFALGGTPGGIALFIQDQHLHFAYNFLNRKITLAKSTKPMPLGKSHISLEFKADSKKRGSGGIATLTVNNMEVGSTHVERTIPARFTVTETFDVGQDSGTSVAPSYRSPFRFSGKIGEVNVTLLD
jgi:arylsulfatase